MKHSRSTMLAAAAGTVLAATFLVPSSDASWTDSEWNNASAGTLSCAAVHTATTRGAGKLLGGEVAGVDLDDLAEVRDVVVTHDGTTSTANHASAITLGDDAYANPLSLQALNAINVTLKDALTLPLYADVGALNQYGQAHGTGVSAGAAGAVADSGAINLDPDSSSDMPRFATVDLGAVLTQLVGPGSGAALPDLDRARLGIGAVASSATLDSCGAAWQGSVYEALERAYAVAGLDAELETPLVRSLVATTNTALTALDARAIALAEPDGAPKDLLPILLGSGGLGPTLGGLLINQDAAVVNLDLNLDLGPVRDLLTQPIQDAGRTLSIDLASGTITVDLATLLGPAYEDSVGLNGLAPNTQLLLDERALSALTKALAGTLHDWTTAVTAALDHALGLMEVRLHLEVPATLLNILGVPVEVATLRIDVGGRAPGQGVSLAALRAGHAPVAVSLTPSGTCHTAIIGALCSAVDGVITKLGSFPTSRILGPLIADVLSDGFTLIAGNLPPDLQRDAAALVSFLPGSLSILFGPDGVLSIMVNAQNEPDPAELPTPSAPNVIGPWPELQATGQYDVAALQVRAVGAIGLLNLDLARSSVGANVFP